MSCVEPIRNARLAATICTTAEILTQLITLHAGARMHTMLIAHQGAEQDHSKRPAAALMSTTGANLTVVVSGPGGEAGPNGWGFCTCTRLWGC